jgi:hypothetical protein
MTTNRCGNTAKSTQHEQLNAKSPFIFVVTDIASATGISIGKRVYTQRAREFSTVMITYSCSGQITKNSARNIASELYMQLNDLNHTDVKDLELI